METACYQLLGKNELKTHALIFQRDPTEKGFVIDFVDTDDLLKGFSYSVKFEKI
jgi:hypothetical protein